MGVKDGASGERVDGARSTAPLVPGSLAYPWGMVSWSPWSAPMSVIVSTCTWARCQHTWSHPVALSAPCRAISTIRCKDVYHQIFPNRMVLSKFCETRILSDQSVTIRPTSCPAIGVRALGPVLASPHGFALRHLTQHLLLRVWSTRQGDAEGLLCILRTIEPMRYLVQVVPDPA